MPNYVRKPSQTTQPRTRGSFLCGSNCLTCKYITVGPNTYTFHSTGETRPINHHIDCNAKNGIYMVQCKRCHKQYIGETKRRHKDRFNEHRRPVDKQINISKPAAVSEHFLSNGHNATDMQLNPLELVKTNRDGIRKAREAYLIERGQTLEPLGLNRRDFLVFFYHVSCYIFFKFQIVTFLTFLTILQLLYRVILCYYSVILYPPFYILSVVLIDLALVCY